MHKRISSSTLFSMLSYFLLFALAACSPKTNSIVNVPEATVTEQLPKVDNQLASDRAVSDIPLATENPASKTPWPTYTLETKLPTSPSNLRLYSQVLPAGLPDEKRLAEIVNRLKITGAFSTQTTEGGDSEISVIGDTGSFRLVSDDPFLLVIENASPEAGNTSAKELSIDLRIQSAETFLNERGLLDFPYLLEPPRLSRERDHALRVVPLIDGYPLHDYDALNGRLLVLFNSSGEISTVFWRPLKIVAGDTVEILPAAEAWEQLEKGDIPKQNSIGQCWQAMIFDPKAPSAIAGPMNSPGCVNWSTGPNPPFTGAQINDVSLVYFATDLSLGMSPFTFPSDSPARIVYPMWQFSGTTSDRRELEVLWPAIKAP